MTWQTVPTKNTNDTWTAAEHNTYVRDNQQALNDAIVTLQGQIVILLTRATATAYSGSGHNYAPGTYTINLVTEFGLPSGLKAVWARLSGSWTAVNASYLAYLQASGGSGAVAIIRPANTTVLNDAFAMVPVSSDQIELVVGGTTLNTTTIEITGYIKQ